jgi:hypothetical protein
MTQRVVRWGEVNNLSQVESYGKQLATKMHENIEVKRDSKERGFTSLKKGLNAHHLTNKQLTQTIDDIINKLSMWALCNKILL